MRIYLDLCCLKRPFDLQDHPLVRLQTEAVLSIEALPSSEAELIRSGAQVLENSLNPVQSRREAVDLWLSQGSISELSEPDVRRRIDDLRALGFKSFDSFHIASAELSGAAVFVTVDDQIHRVAGRHVERLRVRVVDPVELVEEISRWKR